MSELLRGKVAVVTGSGQGVGRAVALALAAEGAKVVTNNRKPVTVNHSDVLDEAKLSRLTPEQREWVKKELAAFSGDAETTARAIREAGGEATACFADISRFDEAERLIRTAVEAYGSVDILVNVAGSFGFSPIEKMPEEMWDRVNGVKPKGYFNTVRHAVPYMIQNGWGRIINCASPAYTGSGGIRHSEYCAANAAVVAFTTAIAEELEHYGITCNVFSPHAKTRASIDMEVFDKTVAEEDRASIHGNPPIGAYDDTPYPDTFAPFVAYLASDEAKDITGKSFFTTGGFLGLFSQAAIIQGIHKEGPWTMEDMQTRVHQQLLASRPDDSAQI